MTDKELNISKYIGSIPSDEMVNPKETTQKAADLISTKIDESKAHIINMGVVENIYNEGRFKSILEEGRTMPTCEDVDFVVNKVMTEHNISKGDVARLLGVSPLGNSTVNKWINSEGKSRIPYCAWRILCIYAGLSIELRLPEDVKSKIIK